MKKIITILILSAFLFGCATTGKQKTETRTNKFQDILGFVITGSGLAGGAYIGSQAADKNDQTKSFFYGFAGGLIGGLISGGIYYIAMQIVAEKVDVLEEEPKADETILMPK